MSAHRLQALLGSTNSAPMTMPGASCAFVPCPAPLLSAIPVAQHLFIQDVYRIARERAEAQIRPAFRVPEFSMN